MQVLDGCAHRSPSPSLCGLYLWHHLTGSTPSTNNSRHISSITPCCSFGASSLLISSVLEWTKQWQEVAHWLSESPTGAHAKLSYLKHENIMEIRVGPVPARYIRHSQMWPQLDVSDKNEKKMQEMSDRARYVRHQLFAFSSRFPEKGTHTCAYITHMHASTLQACIRLSSYIILAGMAVF